MGVAKIEYGLVKNSTTVFDHMKTYNSNLFFSKETNILFPKT